MNFDFVLTSSFVSIWCFVIFVGWAVYVVKLWRQSSDLISKLSYCKSEIDKIGGKNNFVENFELYNSKVENKFGTPWKEFVETLVLPEPGSTEPIRNTQPVSHYLNDASIVTPKIPFGFYRSLPNLFTGFGILGTFIGLAVGVETASNGFTSEDSGQITESLQRLLDGASLAFVTSLFGILSSMAFVVVERRRSRKLHLAVDGWVEAIETRIGRVTSEGVALRQLEQARRATKQLEKFNNELVFSIEQALEEKIAGRLSPQLDRLVEVVQGLRADRSSEAGEMIAQVLRQFTNAMQERTGSEFEEMANIVSDLNRTLKDVTDGMAKSQHEIRTALQEVLSTVKTSMNDGTNAMTETLQESLRGVTREIASASAGLAEQLTSSSSTAAAELQKTMVAATDGIANTAVDAVSKISGSLVGLEGAAENLDRSTQQSQRVLTQVMTFVDQIDTLGKVIETAQRQITDATAPIVRAAGQIEAASGRTADALSRTSTLVDRIDSNVKTLEQHQAEVAKAWTHYQNRFEGIDNSLAKVFLQIDEGLSGYCAQVKKFANDLDRVTSKTIHDLAGATHELDQSIEDLIEHLRLGRHER